MAGHSKWANIQHHKKKVDAKRGKIFTKLIRAITVAARLHGGDMDSNPRLRDAVDKAKAANMSVDTIQRAIKKGSGDLEADNMEEVTYEGYGPGGVAVMVACLTDNRNRTVSEVRHAFSKCGGNLGTDGSVAYLFNKQGLMIFPQGSDEEKIVNAAIEAGALDVQTNTDGSIEVTTEADSFDRVKKAMETQKLNPEMAEVTMLPTTWVELDAETAEKMIRLQDMLDDLDDVQNVYSNADIPEGIA